MFLQGPQILEALQTLGSAAKVRCAVPYITQAGMRLLLDARPKSLQLITQVWLQDVANGAMSLDALELAIAEGASVRIHPSPPRLHAKVFSSDTNAILGSANLTGAALERNLEAATLLADDAVQAAQLWLDGLWRASTPLMPADIEDFRARSSELESLSVGRIDHALQPYPAAERVVDATQQVVSQGAEDEASGVQVFTCNSGRSHSDAWEPWMLDNDVAAAWQEFSSTTSFESARPGDLILLYRNGVGVIACGVVRAPCRVFPPDLPRRFDDEPTTECYELSVVWQRLAAPVEWKPITPSTFARAIADVVRARMPEVLRQLAP